MGSQAFERTSRRLHLLTVATHAAYADLRALVQRGQLADNLPLLIMNRMRQMPAELQQKIQQGIDSSNTGLFDTHPATSERIAAARRENAPGILHSDQPASDLFVHNDATCRNVTWDLYRGIFGSRIKPSDLRPTVSLLSEAGTAAVND